MEDKIRLTDDEEETETEQLVEIEQEGMELPSSTVDERDDEAEDSLSSSGSSTHDEQAYQVLDKDDELISRRFRHLAQSFRERTQRVKSKFELPPTPSTISSEPEDLSIKAAIPPATQTSAGEAEMMNTLSREWLATAAATETSRAIVEPQSCLYITWLTLVTLSYLYNCFVIPLRTTFPYQTPENIITWLALDYSMDAIYFLDMAFIKPRIAYLEDGFWVRCIRDTRKNYIRKTEFLMDILSLTPLDLLYLYFGPNQPLLRLPRLLKIHSFWEFFNHFDKVSPSPYIVRVARTLTYMLYLVHLNACAYYAVSVNEGIASNHWVFNGEGNAYIRCFYFAVKTATSIGKNPRPENEAEYLFMTASWLMGVFVFAILIGQIRDIIATATRTQTEYRKLMDETLHHLRKLNLPPRLLERVKTWFSYTWQQQHTLDESRVLDTLPHKMKTDVAINVHISTLNKVQLFKDCDEALLRELVLKLRPVLYLPGDYICRKGEVGREMYIVKSGQVQVVTGIDGHEVLATLTEGSVFGEISLLEISGGNRRTADVRSNGYSNLFVLSKDDLNEALRFHPNAQEILRKKAKNLVRQNAARERRTRAEVLIGNPGPLSKQPKLLPIIMKMLPPNSGTAKLLKYGSKSAPRGRTRRLNTTHNETVDDPIDTALRCHSVDLGMLGFLDREFKISASETPTFQCNVTVHREMCN
ncbi:cyclic nucleotide-gated ion channel subunit B isoform X1 [Rhodnius prolixus]|uniref:cyclic nucleotide-gated ion channel subunit B isoform X1 n=1 Tax=Rhodnius prolixus TaxID=13249 RepID=UPI003D1899F9